MLEKGNISSILKSPIVIILPLWLIVQYVLFLYYGFVTDFEGLKYQYDGHLIAQSFHFNPERIFYVTYSIIVAIFYKLHIGLYGVLVFQLLVSGYSVYLLYKILFKYIRSLLISTLLTSIYILTIQVQMWNFHLFTESLFVSGIIIFMNRLFTFSEKEWRSSISVILLLIALSYLRPIGIALMVPASFYLLILKVKENRKTLPLLIIISLFTIIHISFMLLAQSNFNEFFEVATKKMWIIGAYDTADDYAVYIPGWLGYFPFIKAIFIRTFYYFSMLRPFYSFIHNILESFFYPIFIFSIFGFYNLFKRQKSLFVFIIFAIAIFTGFTLLTHVNYHGRYIVPILPLFVIASGFGLQYILKRFKRI